MKYLLIGVIGFIVISLVIKVMLATLYYFMGKQLGGASYDISWLDIFLGRL